MGSVSVADLVLQVGKVFGFAGGIGDEVEELGSQTGDDCVVYDAAGCWMEEAGEG